MTPGATMTATSPSKLPRTLTAEQAAEYLGCRSAAQFRREVAAGVWPKPLVASSRPQRWSIAELESALRPDRSTEQSSAVVNLERRLGIANDLPAPTPRLARRKAR